MSSTNRPTPRGGKGTANKVEASTTTKQKTDSSKSESPKSLDHNPKIQPTAEQMRIAQIIDKSNDDPDFKDKVRQVMDLTQRSEDDVCTALHDCDNDADRAANMLLEGMGQGEWETSVKKKKSRPSGTNKTETAVNNRDAEHEDWNEKEANPERERTRMRGGGPPRMRGRGSLDNRGWRGREHRENERNLDDHRDRDGFRRGGGRMMNGPGRSGRGGRGGRLGPRTFQNREKGGFPRSIETWNNPSTEDNSGDTLKMEQINDFKSSEDWDSVPYDGTGTGNISESWGDDFPSPEDWDNEEYTGSLADSKVFTPSSGGPLVGVVETTVVEPSTSVSTEIVSQTLSSSVVSNSSQMSQNMEILQNTNPLAHSFFQNSLQNSLPAGVGSLNAAQSEYLSQLTQQASENMKTATATSSGSYGTGNTYNAPVSSASYQSESPPAGFTSTATSFPTSNYVGSTNTYSNQIQEQDTSSTVTTQIPTQTSRTKSHRTRIPGSMKIPSSAVEMPMDPIASNMAYLDVQFGALEFGSETATFESATEQQQKYTNNVLEPVPSPRTNSSLELGNSNQTSNLDSYSTNSTQKTNQTNMTSLNQNQKLSGSSETMLQVSDHKQGQSTYSQPTRVLTGSTNLDMEKNDTSGLSYSTSNAVSYQSSYPSQKSTYQPSAASYSSSTYSSTQIPVTTTATTTTYPSNQAQLNYSTSTSNYSSQTVAPSSYQNSSYTQPSYQVTVANNTPLSYQAAVYGNYAAPVSQYQNTYNVSTTVQSHAKLNSTLNAGTKEQYDTVTTSNNVNVTTTNAGLSANVNSAVPTLGIVSTNQSVSTTSKVTNSTGKNSVIPNIPPGVPPIMGTHQYIMSQGGLPYFQPPVYSYDELHLMQQRIPHMTAGYYDMGFQAPTTLATAREGGLASVAYSMSDGRFTRADNNASPVPSTLSQQTASQAHQQPMINATALPPGYAYFYSGSMMPGSFQYGTPAIYPVPPVTNAHATSSSTQYAKPATYGSAYASAYDGLSQTQDYGKTSYVSGSQSQSKSGVGATAGNTGSSAADLSASMYGKSHVAIGKVNSYEKQGFHSGTPPPFNMAGSQSTPMAASGAYAPHLFIPTIPPHQQHHTTQLLHQPLHQMEMRNPGRRSESSSGSTQRAQSSNQANKSGAKQGYSPSYWAPN